jgi:hypothetical protein
MESSVPHTRRTVQTDSDVLWPYKFAHHLSNDDEHDIPERGIIRVALCIHGQHSNPHETKSGRNRKLKHGEAPKTHTLCTRQTRETQSIP